MQLICGLIFKKDFIDTKMPFPNKFVFRTELNSHLNQDLECESNQYLSFYIQNKKFLL